MNLHALRVFVAVAEAQSIGIAARNLYISQPAVSQLIKKLEQRYQVQLIEPAGRGIRLTALGQRVYEQAQPLFEQERLIEQTLTQQAERMPLMITATQLALDQLLAGDFIAQANALVPLKLQVANTDQIITALERQRTDFALMPQTKIFSGYRQTVTTQDQWLFASAMTHMPQLTTLRDVVKLPLLTREAGSKTDQALQMVLGELTPLHPLEVNSQSEALKLAQAQQGIYFGPASSLPTTSTLVPLQLTDYQPLPRILVLYERQRRFENSNYRQVATLLKTVLKIKA